MVGDSPCMAGPRPEQDSVTYLDHFSALLIPLQGMTSTNTVMYNSYVLFVYLFACVNYVI